MADITIAAGQTFGLYYPVSSGTNITFQSTETEIAAADNQYGVLLLDTYASNSFSFTNIGSLTYATLGGTIENFLPAYMGIPGDQVRIHQISSLFAALDSSPSYAADNADFSALITNAAGPDQWLILPSGAVEYTNPSDRALITLDANAQLVIDEIAQAVFGNTPSLDNAILYLEFDKYQNPNREQNFLVDGVFTTETPLNPCFCPGTRILTPLGEVPVEALAAGARVITLQGEERRIIWAGRREVDILAHPQPETVRPIIIEADALADGVPARRLKLSPDHALYLDGVLVPAKALLNWTNIRPDLACARIAYHHFELETHDVVFAEGAPAETFLDTGHRGVFGEGAVVAHPAVMQQRREALGFAPLCLGGEALGAIRQRLAARQVGIRLG